MNLRITTDSNDLTTLWLVRTATVCNIFGSSHIYCVSQILPNLLFVIEWEIIEIIHRCLWCRKTTQIPMTWRSKWEDGKETVLFILPLSNEIVSCKGRGQGLWTSPVLRICSWFRFFQMHICEIKHRSLSLGPSALKGDVWPWLVSGGREDSS